MEGEIWRRLEVGEARLDGDGEDAEEYPQSDDGEEGTVTLNGDTLDTSIVLSLCPR